MQYPGIIPFKLQASSETFLKKSGGTIVAAKDYGYLRGLLYGEICLKQFVHRILSALDEANIPKYLYENRRHENMRGQEACASLNRSERQLRLHTNDVDADAVPPWISSLGNLHGNQFNRDE
ncbi:MAG TPA: hypothetical protein VHV54_23185 [Candidatus Binatia bacterium]|nr:hypothetical protein [Candidatus Binatia bacterium]